MGFLGTVIAWAFSALVALMGIVAGVLVTDADASLGLGTLLGGMFSAGAYGLMMAGILVAAFFVGSLFRAAVPLLSALAYPLVGAGALAVAALVFQSGAIAFAGLTPPGDGQHAVLIHAAAGAAAGLLFEIFRPRR